MWFVPEETEEIEFEDPEADSWFRGVEADRLGNDSGGMEASPTMLAADGELLLAPP